MSHGGPPYKQGGGPLNQGHFRFLQFIFKSYSAKVQVSHLRAQTLEMVDGPGVPGVELPPR